MQQSAPVDTGFKLVGHWKAELHGEDGTLKGTYYNHNIICTNGKEFLASYLASAAATASTFTVKYIAIGTGSTTETAADTTLGVEVLRQTGTVSYVSNQIVQITATFATGSGTGAIAEFGLFSSSTAGTMLARYTRSAINKTATDRLTVTAQLTFT